MVFKRLLLIPLLLMYPLSAANSQLYPIPTVCLPTTQVIGGITSDRWDLVLYSKEITEAEVYLYLFQKEEEILFLKEYRVEEVSCILGIGLEPRSPGEPT